MVQPMTKILIPCIAVVAHPNVISSSQWLTHEAIHLLDDALLFRFSFSTCIVLFLPLLSDEMSSSSLFIISFFFSFLFPWSFVKTNIEAREMKSARTPAFLFFSSSLPKMRSEHGFLSLSPLLPQSITSWLRTHTSIDQSIQSPHSRTATLMKH